ncbi:LL-diaminopimelate aminotransferase [Tepidibacillus fermentans]|uniref:Aminotransferase n=1 Tax=Tepidibacillus fermentans TaxID=1281767 RepID=A0A4V6NZ04_9BACI|nr:LL-diaminopimelate aminotransferase [Tepidibacillus fermentans]TCS83551.1 aspartate/methionine/tyrosine aminotransferase [Tepidibacillus fermentans]
MISISDRVKVFQTNVFSELANYKKQRIEQGLEVIDLSVGSPDLPPPVYVMEALVDAVKDPTQYGYALKGTDEFHEAVADYYHKRFSVQLNPKKEVLQLMGSQDGLVHLPMIFADPGDVILVPDPGYTAYEAGVHLASATLYPMPLKKEYQFLPRLDEIPEEIARKAKVMILNFPGNPVPALATKEFFEEVVQFARKYEIIVIHDFAYSELIFDGHQKISFLEIDGAKEVSIEFNSLSKSFNMAGARIGYIVGNEEIIEEIAKVKSNLDYGTFLPIQKAAATALKDDSEFLTKNAKIYQDRRDVLVDGLSAIGWHVDKPPATMFVWAEIPKGWASKEFALELIKAGVVVTPGNAFGAQGEGYVRIALVQSEEKLKRAIQLIDRSGILKRKI